MVHEISAEFLLNYFYPDLCNQWMVVQKGTFYRNYNDDVMAMDKESGLVELSRDGFLRLLPEAFVVNENSDRRDIEQTQRRLTMLREAFAPFDTFFFNNDLKVEKHVSHLLDHKLDFVLKNYFQYDLEAETDELCRVVAPFLIYASWLRGDIRFLRKLLQLITGHEVRIRRMPYSDTDSTKYCVEKIRFDICIDNLSEKGYREEMNRIAPVVGLIQEWFIPFDSVSDFCITGHSDKGKYLNYNIVINGL